MTSRAKHAVILGGSRGLGELVNIQLERLGWECTSFSRTASLNTRSHFIPCDLSEASDVERAAQALRELASLDAFFWVAGEYLEGPADTISNDAIRRLIEVNLSGGLVLAITAWRRFQHLGKSNNLVVVSSTSGTKARADESLYCATKFAQVGFARSLGIEARNSHHKVALFMPGGMRTSMWAGKTDRDVSSYLDPAAVAQALITAVAEQTDPFIEVVIPRSLG